ncbi:MULTISPECIES: arabinosyltransferase domain-containing protein [unclassified Pseudonocardia]|uniref:arabinosyltransferase domain-containing protein n=1 Tax=unclassified Pseudonocardia TaxID=2619320 RepID=UPI00094AE3F8|nr:arabinosyltransferase domain-containing protein [Pseudonocardia sp. Ae707_Ps1]OLM19588.1 putative arabinosyltransferase C [Pseudonocardia sp. Ae707_Ps1]
MTSPSPTDRPGHGRPPSRALVLATLLSGVLAVVLAALVPFAPVETRDTTVTWPQAGELPSSTTAAFQPTAPESVRVTVPCPVLRAAQDRGGATTVVSTERPGTPGTGFTVLTDGGDVRVQAGGRELVREPIPGGDACGVLLTADAGGARVTLGDAAPRSFPGDVVRTVAAFTTDLAPADAEGLQVTARTADWFEAAPTGTKLVLLGLQWASAATALVLLARLAGDRLRRRRGAWRLWRARLAALRTPSGAGRTVADALVVGTLAVWTVIGPLSTDDGFTEAIARNTTGDDFGNVYRWGNASEAPYTLVIRMVQALAGAGAGPLGLRVPSVLAGIAVWLLLSRVALPAVLPRLHRRAWVRGTLGVALLAWWLPLNLGVRPEPFAALAVTAALCCALRAVARPGGRAGLWTSGAALASGLALAVTPSALTLAGPLLLLVPALWRRFAGRGGPGPRAATLTGAAATVAAAGIAAAGAVVVFTGQSFYTVARATEMHAFYGPAVAWFSEIRRWEYLLGFDNEQGGLGRRLPVLLTIALLVAALPLVARGAHRWTAGLRRTPVPLVGVALGFVLLTPSPSKWTHYFGTLAGVGALAVVAGVALVVAAARRPADATVRGAAAAGTVAAVVLTALVFAGRNDWFLWSGWGVPRLDGPFEPLDSPAVWLLVAVLVLAGTLLAVRPVPRAAAMLPAGVVVTALVTGVAVVVGSLAVAPLRQDGGYSVGAQMWDELTGRGGCGILDHVTVPRDGGALAAAGGEDTLTGFTEGGGWPQPPPDGGTGWGSRDGGPGTTGELTSRWYSVPAGPPDRELTVDVAGRTGQGNVVELEYARAGSAEPDGALPLDDTATSDDARADYPSERVEEATPLDRPGWRGVRVTVGELPEGTDRVRVHAVDDTTDAGGWVAVAAPRLVEPAPVVPMLRDADGPVYVDWSILWSAPCLRDLPAVRAGLVQTPRYLVLGPSSLGFALDVSFTGAAGGSFAAMRRTTTESVIGTRVDTADDPEQDDWGRVTRIDTDLAVDAYDVRSDRVSRWGWEGDRSPLGRPELPPP